MFFIGPPCMSHSVAIPCMLFLPSSCWHKRSRILLSFFNSLLNTLFLTDKDFLCDQFFWQNFTFILFFLILLQFFVLVIHNVSCAVLVGVSVVLWSEIREILMCSRRLCFDPSFDARCLRAFVLWVLLFSSCLQKTVDHYRCVGASV